MNTVVPWPKLVIEAMLKLDWQFGIGARLTDKQMKLYIIFLDVEHENVFHFTMFH